MSKKLTFQEIILTLQQYWNDQGCMLMQAYDNEKGAGTMSPYTFLRAIGPEPWNAAYVEPSRRPADGRYGENPNRLYQHHQFQVVMKPSPSNIQELYLESLEKLGINPLEHDIRFVEDNWENPSTGSAGLVGKFGWTVWKSLSSLTSNKLVVWQLVLLLLRSLMVWNVWLLTSKKWTPFTISSGLLELNTEKFSFNQNTSTQNTALKFQIKTCFLKTSKNLKKKQDCLGIGSGSPCL